MSSPTKFRYAQFHQNSAYELACFGYYDSRGRYHDLGPHLRPGTISRYDLRGILSNGDQVKFTANIPDIGHISKSIGPFEHDDSSSTGLTFELTGSGPPAGLHFDQKK